jgi:hypothetical protein
MTCGREAARGSSTSVEVRTADVETVSGLASIAAARRRAPNIGLT